MKRLSHSWAPRTFLKTSTPVSLEVQVLELQFKAHKTDDVVDNHIEDAEKDNVNFSSELGMILMNITRS